LVCIVFISSQGKFVFKTKVFSIGMQEIRVSDEENRIRNKINVCVCVCVRVYMISLFYLS